MAVIRCNITRHDKAVAARGDIPNLNNKPFGPEP